MGEVDGVAVMVELDAEGERVVMAAGLLLLDGILVVAHVFSHSLPAPSREHGLFVRIHQRLHSVVVQAVRLQKIYNIKSIGPASSRVLQSEIEPLVVYFGVVVRLQNEVVFELVHLNGPS